ncbi:hypothetical protein DPSP01_006405 [Paraphaeosphaeria sporulosa]|uniref:WD40 repeat-like protein n=1 Tax=Paraphaeosphaeria sporulosa TaxID=1460663 RepID=A0A177BUU9_9PLEO|nr:WD40 repeat-like protein [Paraphaeosphaeria sporulosa]OAF98750.1 WD40 repeat-like protein [Paraphaeosphaeria sporulosa]
MNAQQIANRAYGISPTHVIKRALVAHLVYALQPSSVSFSARLPSPHEPNERHRAHIAGVNALTIDRFDGRYLLSGGADSSVALWDLEARPTVVDGDATYAPLSTMRKTAEEHKLGITQVSFYPFDSLAFLTSSYDHTVKIYSSETLMPSASFDLGSVVYSIALSPIASHLLVACATQHPTVRLVDLRSGASSHSLAGHSGAILSTAWSPTREHILASGATDGSVRFWDVRRSVSELGILDMEDSVGLLGRPASLFMRNSVQGKAHRGPVNGIVWTEDGHHLVTCGHDQRIRVWDTNTGANTLANFGPMVKNSDLAPCIPLLPPAKHLQSGKDVLFYPNEHEILGYELFDGKLFRRLRRTEQQKQMYGIRGQGQRNAKDKITSLAWRAHDVEMYSAHSDGSISVWLPRTEEDAALDEEAHEEQESKDESKKRKRGVLDEIYQDLTKRSLTFGGM